MAETVHQFEFRVSPADIDRLGHVNNVTFVRYVQDAAVSHWQSVAPPDVQSAVVWVCRRHEIDYLKPAFADELLGRALARRGETKSLVLLDDRVELAAAQAASTRP